MPGYVIHIAVATEYIRKFGTSDEAKFIEGTLAPDLLAVGGKAKTHYSKSTSDKTDLGEFLRSNEIHSSYMEGYFLHLIADFLFYIIENCSAIPII